MMHDSTMPAASPTSVWQMYRAMVGVGLICGLALVTVFQWTEPIIERNKAVALQQAIFQVLPGAESSKTFGINDAQRFEPIGPQTESAQRIYAGYDSQQRLIGLAVKAEGMGYQDVIKILYGYSFADEAIVAIHVLESKETPGLGDKIEKDPEFLANFQRLDVSLGDDLTTLAHPIEPVKHGTKTQPWEVDGITGATISSKAIANILKRSTAYWIPKIRKNLNDFKEVTPG
jgi:electron transport complex protein RnfG